MLNNNNKDIVENGVSKNDMVSNSRYDENIMGVEVSEGVVVSVDDLEREWRESLSEHWWRRAIFPCDVGEVKASRMYLGDKWSTNSPLGCYNVTGKARW